MGDKGFTKAALVPVRDPRVTPKGGDPYDELAEFGVTYDSSMAEVHQGGLEAQRRGALTPARSNAWRELRNAEKRLLVDFLYYQPDPAVFSLTRPEPSGRSSDRQIDPWLLLQEAWERSPEALPELSPPTSFLEEE